MTSDPVKERQMFPVDRMRVLPALMIGALALAVPVRALALEQAYDEIGNLFGFGIPDTSLVGSDKHDKPNALTGVRYGHLFTDTLGLFADATYAAYDGDRVAGNSDVTTVRSGVEWSFSPGRPSRWFLSGGAGWMSVSPDAESSFDRGLLCAGFGQRRNTSTGNSLRWEIRWDRSLGHAGSGGEDISTAQALFGWSWGIGYPPADNDGDGVPDRKDQCPETPRGATVGLGGCPSDADGDGVYDGLDGCPGTAEGTPVDAQGCPRDSDGDGVHDGADRCPNTPASAKVDAHGCPIDSDVDGVYDGLDRCPGTPRGATADAVGCPIDGDGDGVYDGLDRCLDTPAGTKVDAMGCPLPPPEPPKAEPIFEEKKSLVLEGVGFATASAVLTPDSLAILDRVAASLKDWPEVHVEIGGHTDSDGGAKHNLKLSQARAESVRDYLVSQGVSVSQLGVQGYGETKPIADNRTVDGKSKNRRVELSKVE